MHPLTQRKSKPRILQSLMSFNPLLSISIQQLLNKLLRFQTDFIELLFLQGVLSLEHIFKYFVPVIPSKRMIPSDKCIQDDS